MAEIGSSCPHRAGDEQGLRNRRVLLALAATFVATTFPAQRAAFWILGNSRRAGDPFVRRSRASPDRQGAAEQGGAPRCQCAAITLAFLGILVILNVLAVRHNKKWDLTAGKIHTPFGARRPSPQEPPEGHHGHVLLCGRREAGSR